MAQKHDGTRSAWCNAIAGYPRARLSAAYGARFAAQERAGTCDEKLAPPGGTYRAPSMPGPARTHPSPPLITHELHVEVEKGCGCFASQKPSFSWSSLVRPPSSRRRPVTRVYACTTAPEWAWGVMSYPCTAPSSPRVCMPQCPLARPHSSPGEGSPIAPDHYR